MTPVSLRLRALMLVAVAACALAAVLLMRSSAHAAGPAIGLSAGTPERNVVAQGETFFKGTAFHISLATGQTMSLASTTDGTGQLLVDDQVLIKVKHADGTKSTFKHDFSGRCGALTPIDPVDVTSLFRTGLNDVTITLGDLWGGHVLAAPFYLVPSS
jgi:hypothetical protein